MKQLRVTGEAIQFHPRSHHIRLCSYKQRLTISTIIETLLLVLLALGMPRHFKTHYDSYSDNEARVDLRWHHRNCPCKPNVAQFVTRSIMVNNIRTLWMVTEAAEPKQFLPIVNLLR